MLFKHKTYSTGWTLDYSYFNISTLRRDGATWNSYFVHEILDKTNFLNIKELAI